MIYDVGNPGPGLGQAQQCGGVKPVNRFYIIVALAFLIYFGLRKYSLNNSTMKKGKRKTPGDGGSINALDYFLVSDRKEIDKYKPMFCS